MYGFSEENGSWKTIWTPRRYSRISRRPWPQTSISRPSRWKVTRPPLGRYRPPIILPVVVFPQPLSPTRPRVSPRRIVKLTPSTALMCPHRPVEQAPLDGEVLRQVLDLEQGVGERGFGSVGHGARLGYSQQETAWPGATSSSSGMVLHSSVACGQRAAKGQPWITCMGLGTEPAMTSSFAFGASAMAGIERNSACV